MNRTRNDFERRDSRRREAIERQELATHRDPLEQAMRLDDLLGASKGAKKERARLKILVAERKEAK